MDEYLFFNNVLFYEDIFKEDSQMKKNKLIFLVSGFVMSIVLFSGCIFIIGGAVGALGGYAISQDTIQGETNNSYTRVWKAATETMRTLGTISVEDKTRGTIEAKVNSSTVKVFVEEVIEGATRLRVKARKHLFPNLKLSQKIYVKVIEGATK